MISNQQNNHPYRLHLAWRITAACLILFLLTVAGVTQSSAVQELDQDAAEDVYQSLPDSWCKFMTWWGHDGLYALGGLAAGVLLFKRQWVLLLVEVATLGGGMLLQSELKPIIARDRPAYASVDTYSFPSGHTLLSVLVYGFLIYLLMRQVQDRRARLLLISAGALWVFLIGISRVSLGDHFPGDILGSMALGGLWLGLCLGALDLYRRRSTAFRREDLYSDSQP